MTISEATCCEEYPYFKRSKTKVQNANRLEVQLHKMNAELLSSQAINWSLEKTIQLLLFVPNGQQAYKSLGLFTIIYCIIFTNDI